MSERFDKVKEYVLELDFSIDEEIAEEEIVIINDDERGMHNLAPRLRGFGPGGRAAHSQARSRRARREIFSSRSADEPQPGLRRLCPQRRRATP